MINENKNKRAATIDEEDRYYYFEDSACAICKWANVWSENPDAENGPGSISYAECEMGYGENFGTYGGCWNWEQK